MSYEVLNNTGNFEILIKKINNNKSLPRKVFLSLKRATNLPLWLLGKVTKHIMGKHKGNFNSPSCQFLTVRVRFLQGGSELTIARGAEENGEQMHQCSKCCIWHFSARNQLPFWEGKNVT